MNTQINPFSNSSIIASPGAAAQTDQQRAIAEVQIDRMMAKQYPRDCIGAMDRILNACSRPSLANVAIYSYAKGGNNISGPSIRLAEAIAQAWGNIKFGIRELDQRNGQSTVQAFAYDNETGTNREITFQVMHTRHTKKGSYKLEDPRDIYELVANQGARRLRTCILSIIPGDVIESALNQCEVTLRASADLSPDGIKKILSAFEKFGVTKEQIEARIQRNIDAIQPDQVINLKKIYTSLKDGMSTISDWFDINQDDKNNTADIIKAKLAKKSEKPIEISIQPEVNMPILNEENKNFVAEMEKVNQS